jgi:hypothetical protein
MLQRAIPCDSEALLASRGAFHGLGRSPHVCWARVTQRLSGVVHIAVMLGAMVADVIRGVQDNGLRSLRGGGGK